MPTSSRHRAVLVSLSSLFLLPCSLFPQGSLTPPGAPTPTMKTLDQVEPRIAVNATNTPGNANAVYNITQPGSYYLTGTVTGVSAKDGIRIASSGVTLDLNGFEVLGVAGSNIGVDVPSGTLTNIAILNGSIRNWGSVGVYVNGTVTNVRAISLLVSGNGDGIRLTSSGNTISQCTATNNTLSWAIFVGPGSTVSNCSVYTNLTTYALHTFDNCTVSNCLVDSNDGHGIVVSNQCNVISCSVTNCLGNKGGISTLAGSTVSNCTSGFNNSNGILTTDGCTVTNCSVDGSGTFGILVGTGCMLANCTVINSGTTGITASSNSSLANCTTNGNAAAGINVANGCNLQSCIANINSTTGINAGSECVLTTCTANNNTGAGIVVVDGCSLQGCVVNNNTLNGVTVRFGNTVRACHVRGNQLNGIESNEGGQIIDNFCDSNGLAANTQSNIYLTSDGCRVEGNSVFGGDRGIATIGGGNVIVRNSVRGGTNAYGGIAVGNDVGPIGSAATATSPWANISY